MPSPAMTACLIVSLLSISMPIFGLRPAFWKNCSISMRVPDPRSRVMKVSCGEVGRRELPLPCQRVIGGGDDDMRMLAQQAHLDIDVGRRLAHHRDIEIIAAQRVADVLAIADRERDIDLREALREGRDRERHEIFRRADGADRNAAAAAARDHVERLLAVEQSGFDTFGQRQNLASGIGQRHAVAGPLDQRQVPRVPAGCEAAA